MGSCRERIEAIRGEYYRWFYKVTRPFRRIVKVCDTCGMNIRTTDGYVVGGICGEIKTECTECSMKPFKQAIETIKTWTDGGEIMENRELELENKYLKEALSTSMNEVVALGVKMKVAEKMGKELTHENTRASTLRGRLNRLRTYMDDVKDDGDLKFEWLHLTGLLDEFIKFDEEMKAAE